MNETLKEIGIKTFLFYKILKQLKEEKEDVAFKSYLAMILDNLSKEIKVLVSLLSQVEGSEVYLQDYLRDLCLTEKEK